MRIKYSTGKTQRMQSAHRNLSWCIWHFGPIKKGLSMHVFSKFRMQYKIQTNWKAKYPAFDIILSNRKKGGCTKNTQRMTRAHIKGTCRQAIVTNGFHFGVNHEVATHPQEGNKDGKSAETYAKAKNPSTGKKRPNLPHERKEAEKYLRVKCPG